MWGLYFLRKCNLYEKQTGVHISCEKYILYRNCMLSKKSATQLLIAFFEKNATCIKNDRPHCRQSRRARSDSSKNLHKRGSITWLTTHTAVPERKGVAPRHREEGARLESRRASQSHCGRKPLANCTFLKQSVTGIETARSWRFLEKI
jgi:hypothetical protein